MTNTTNGDPFDEERARLLEEIEKALALSVQIANYRRRLEALSAQSFKPRPTEPVKKVLPPPQYPAIKPQVPFWSSELLPALFFWPWILIYYFGKYQTKLKEETQRIQNTPEYQQQCAVIDEAHRQREAAAEEQYQTAVKHYDEHILPAYEKELAQWTHQHNEEILALKTALEALENELAEHYSSTRVVPLQYRRIDALQYIYDTLESSNYTLEQAINSYEQAIQRQIEEERLEEDRRRADAAERAAEAEERAAAAEEQAAWAASRAAAAAENAATAAQKTAAASKPQEKKDYRHSGPCRRIKDGPTACSRCTLAPMCKSAGK
jgi:hypothetical protein